MKQVLIRAKRNGYGTDQCGHTMTVGELIDFLNQFNEDTPVYLSHDNGYTFGSITEYDFKEVDAEEEDAEEEDE